MAALSESGSWDWGSFRRTLRSRTLRDPKYFDSTFLVLELEDLRELLECELDALHSTDYFFWNILCGNAKYELIQDLLSGFLCQQIWGLYFFTNTCGNKLTNLVLGNFSWARGSLCEWSTESCSSNDVESCSLLSSEIVLSIKNIKEISWRNCTTWQNLKKKPLQSLPPDAESTVDLVSSVCSLFPEESLLRLRETEPSPSICFYKETRQIGQL